MIQSIILTAMGALTGIFSGLFGVGGGVILVPLLVLNQIPIHQAVAMSLTYIVMAGLSGTYTHFKQGNTLIPLSLLLALSASATVTYGARSATLMSEQQLSFAFAILVGGVLSIFIYKTFRKKSLPQQEEFHFHFTIWIMLKTCTIGLLAGFVSGLFGIGGGFLMVPLLASFLNLPMKNSVGTGIAATVMIACTGVLSHYLYGALKTSLDQYGPVLILMGLAGMITARIGAKLTKQLPEMPLRYAYIVFALCAGSYMFIRSFS